MTEQIRLHNFLRDLNRYMQYEVSVVDFDEKGNCIYDDDEDYTYLQIMENQEWHLLGTETVRKYIHMWYTNWSEMSRILEAEGIF